MRAIIFVNGIVTDTDWIAGLIEADDYLIGADGGTYHCLNSGHVPHLIVGDLDSLDPATKERLSSEGVSIAEYPCEKDQTDLELAIELAVQKCSDVILVGALGGRLDQMLANLLILAQRDWQASIKIVDNQQVAESIRGGETVRLSGQIGDTFSAIPLSNEVTGVTYTGFRYPLNNATLALGSTWGVSNEFAAEEATVAIESGILLLITMRHKPAHRAH
ncbi:MAG: thiamine diphosphokinase [Chloroflexota bacterium]